MNFTVAKNGRHWAILLDGQPYSKNGSNYCYYKRKCDALGAIPDLQQRLEYEARILADDKDGVYRWTSGELANIDEYVAALKENKTKFTMAGHRHVQDMARSEHDSDAHCIESHYAWGEPGEWGKIVCAEIRRRRAARVIAFERAGLALDRNRYDLHCSRKSRDFKSHFTYSTREEAEATMQDIIKRGAEFGELDYEFQISAGRIV